MTALFPLTGRVRDYAWGDRHTIADLLGVTPTGGPMAELWLGAHPGAPAQVTGTNRSLLDVVGADPVNTLGAEVAERFGGLPFLLKVLAVEDPLSLQAHPSRDQAAAGYAAEEKRGVPLEATERNYRDRNHKPEMICALSSFAALCGFRPVPDSLRLLDALAVPALDEHRRRLAEPDGLRAVVTELLTRPGEETAALIAALGPAAQRLAQAGGPFAAEARWLHRLGQRYPGDPGVAIAVLLNLVALAPGESMFLPAGRLHTYLHGVGVELLANSDNVLRGGLTGKHVDGTELLRVLDFTPAGVRPEPGTAHPHGSSTDVVYPSPVPDFQLHRLELRATPIESPPGGPRVLLCVAGALRASGELAVAPLRRGDAAFVPAGTPLQLSGDPCATVFLATVRSRSSKS